MTNPEAAHVLREYIRTNKPCNGLEMALQKAITALEHQPEPRGAAVNQQCNACGQVQSLVYHVCACGSTDLRPIYEESNIGQVTP